MKSLMTKKTVLTIAATLALGIAVNAVAEDSPEEEAVEYRQGAFTMISHHFGAMAAMVKGETEYNAETFAENAEAVAALSQFPINGFIDGSYGGESGAKEHIGDNMDDFKEKMEAFQVSAVELAEAAGNGSDLNTLKPVFGKVGESCKACHNEYRKKD